MVATRAVTLTRDRALALQRQLLEGFTEPQFQKKLDELEGRYHGSCSAEFATARRVLVREVQAAVVPRFAFEATDEGVRQMVVEVERFVRDGDEEIVELSGQIDRALRCDSRGGMNRDAVERLLRAHVEAFSTKEFQHKIKELILRSANADELSKGRTALALEAQRLILPRFNFAGTPQGVMAMMTQVAKYADVHKVATLLDEMNSKLGLSPKSCAEFRSRLLLRHRAPAAAKVDDKVDQDRPQLEALFEASPRGAKRAAGGGADITQARAVALFEDLEQEFRSKSFQDKLQALVQNNQDPSVLPAWKEMVHKVYKEVLPRYNFHPTSEDLAGLVFALEPHMHDPALAAKVKQLEALLRVPKGKSRILDAVAPEPGRPALTKARCMELLEAMCEGYSHPDFQRRLAASMSSGNRPPNTFKLLARSVQVEVLPRFGFKGSEEGLKEMVAQVDKFSGDEDVKQLIEAVAKAMSVQPEAPERKVGLQCLERHDLVALLREQLVSFSSVRFQSEVRQLQERSAIEDDDFLHLLGRSELALTVQSRLFPNYGLEPGKGGQHVLHAYCVKYARDKEVRTLVERTQLALGMKPTAVKKHMESLLEARPAEKMPDWQLRATPEPAAQASAPLAPAPAPPAATPRVVAPSAGLTLSEASAPRLVAPASPATSTSSSSSAPQISRHRASALVTELENGIKAARKRQRRHAGVAEKAALREKDNLEAAWEEQVPMESSAEVKAPLMKSFRDEILKEALLQYGFPGNEDGLRQIVEAAQPHFVALGLEARVGALLAVLLPEGGKEKEAPVPAPEPEPEVPKIAIEQALELHQQLLDAFSLPKFAKQLRELYRMHGSTTPQFAKAFSQLVASATAGPFEAYGLPSDVKDLDRTCLALAPFFADESAQATLYAIDEALYEPAARRPSSEPGLRTVVAALRHQLAAFSGEDFQDTLRALKEKATAVEKEDGYFNLRGRNELALQVQQEILPLHGFEGSSRGVHALLMLSGQYCQVPQVASLLDATNALLGMEPKARRTWKSRMAAATAVAFPAGAVAA